MVWLERLTMFMQGLRGGGLKIYKPSLTIFVKIHFQSKIQNVKDLTDIYIFLGQEKLIVC